MAETAVEGYPKTLVEVSLGDGALTAVVRDVFVTWLLHAGVDDDDILGPLLDLNPPEEPTTGTARAVVLDMIQGALDAAVLKRVCTSACVYGVEIQACACVCAYTHGTFLQENLQSFETIALMTRTYLSVIGSS